VSAGATPAAARTREVEARRAEGDSRAGGAEDVAKAKADRTANTVASPAAPSATTPPERDTGSTAVEAASKRGPEPVAARPLPSDPKPKQAAPPTPAHQAAPAAAATTTTDVGPMLPVATTPPPPKHEKVPFWRRITMQRTGGPSLRGGSIEPLVTRIAALERQISANQATTLSRLENLEQNITRLWELEEQLTLTEVRERLAVMEANQEEIADSMHAVARNLAIVAVVLALAVAAGVFALGILL
jgi:hypothetical protein